MCNEHHVGSLASPRVLLGAQECFRLFDAGHLWSVLSALYVIIFDDHGSNLKKSSKLSFCV